MKIQIPNKNSNHRKWFCILFCSHKSIISSILFQMDWKEEFELLSSMLLKPGESCEIIGEKPCPILKVIQNEFSLTFELDNYPGTVPKMALNSSLLDRKTCDELLQTLNQEASTCLGEPMLFQLSQLANDKIIESLKIVEEQRCEGIELRESRVTLIEIDHMRNQTKYVKHLQAWTSQLSISVLILHVEFLAKHWILVNYTEENELKQFMKNLKTQNVDVDSKGKPCKERLSTILCTKSSLSKFKENFKEENVKSKSELQSILKQIELENILEELKM